MKQSTLNFRIEGESVIWDSGGQPSQASARERKLWAEIEQLRAALKGLHKACVHPMLYRPDSQCNAEQSRQKKRALETYSTACEATVNALRLSTPIDSGSSPACHASTSDETSGEAYARDPNIHVWPTVTAETTPAHCPYCGEPHVPVMPCPYRAAQNGSDQP